MSARVYIGRLSYRARERDIERFFKGYGRIRDIMLKNGYGFVEFDDYRDADDAVYELNGRDMCGERVIVEHARGTPRGEDYRRDRERGYDRRPRDSGRDKYGPPTRTDYRIIVENLSSRVSWQDLKDFMRKAGEVTYADAHKEHKNEGVVEFSSYSEMKRAIEKLDGTELQGRKIKLVQDKSGGSKRRSRSSSRSHSRSRSPRSRTRSRSAKSSASRSRSKSASRSRSKSKSRSPVNNAEKKNDKKEENPANDKASDGGDSHKSGE